MVAKEPGSFIITERFGILPALWGIAILSLGGAVVLQSRSQGAVLDVPWLLSMLFFGLLLIAWEIVRRWRCATLRVRGESVEVLRRGECVASFQRTDMVPWSTRKQVRDIVRGGVFTFFILLVGGLIIVLEKGSLKSILVGGAIIVLGLGIAASLYSMLFRHWTVDVPNAKSWMPWMPMMLTFRRADMLRLLDGESSTRPFLDVIRERTR